MAVSIILAHPNKASFNHAIARTAADVLRRNGYAVSFHDLYDEKFDPLMPTAELGKEPSADALVRRHCAEIAEAEGIVIVHPNWWGQPPAILKGWIDRVLRQGVAYEFRAGDNGEGVPVGLLKAQSAIVFTTSNTPMDRELAAFGDPLDNLWKRCVLEFCGVRNVHRTNYSVVVISTLPQRQMWLADVAETVNRTYPPRV